MKALKPIFGVLIFLCMQLTGGILVAICSSPTEDGHISTPETIAWITVITGIISVIVVWKVLKTIQPSTAFRPNGIVKIGNWGAYMIAVAGSIAGLLGINMLSEQLDLPNTMEEEFLLMSQSTIGAISIGVVAPLVEELIFRESLIGPMLRNGQRPWVAIGISALAFGIIHMNPAQIFFATIIGLLLGTLYWKTGNILLPALVHIINNTFAVYQMREMGEASKDFTYSDNFDSTSMMWGVAIGTLLVSVLLIWLFCHLYSPNQPKQDGPDRR